jgi:hypothetical protein
VKVRILLLLGLAVYLVALFAITTKYRWENREPSAVTVSASGFIERAISPAVFLTCHTGYAAEALPTGGDLVVHCIPINGDAP